MLQIGIPLPPGRWFDDDEDDDIAAADTEDTVGGC
jgi:hypothetical protein